MSPASTGGGYRFGIQVVRNLTPRLNAADVENFSAIVKFSYEPRRYNTSINCMGGLAIGLPY